MQPKQFTRRAFVSGATVGSIVVFARSMCAAEPGTDYPNALPTCYCEMS